MNTATIIHLRDFNKYSQQEIGTYGEELKKLHKQTVPLPRSFCLPIATLKKISQDNNLNEEILKLVNKSTVVEAQQVFKRIQKLIKQQKIPSEVKRDLSKLFKSAGRAKYYKVIASDINIKESEWSNYEENIKGEANLIESILKVWSKQIRFHNNLDSADIDYLSSAIIIQAQLEFDVSGIAFTKNIFQQNKDIVIKANYGITPSKSNRFNNTFYVNQSKWVVNKTVNNNQTAYFKRSTDKLKQLKLNKKQQSQAALNNDTAIKLAKLVKKIKLNSFKHLEIEWGILSNKIYVTKLLELDELVGIHPSITKATQTLLIGNSAVRGVVTGKVRFIDNLNDITAFPHGHIAAVSKITPTLLTILDKAIAVISESSIVKQSLLDQLKNKQLPTIIGVTSVFKILKEGQTIIADTANGKIYNVLSSTTDKCLDKSNEKQSSEGRLKILGILKQKKLVDDESYQFVNGIGMIDSDSFLSEVKSKKEWASSYENMLLNKLKQISYLNQVKTIVYRLSSCYTLESNGLKQQTTFNGGIKIVHNLNLLDKEIEIINRIQKKLKVTIKILLPLIRSSFESTLIIKHIKQLKLKSYHKPSILLEVSSPENILNLDQYLNKDIYGLSLNYDLLHASIYSTNPNNDEVLNYYPYNHQLVKKLLQHFQIKLNNSQQKYYHQFTLSKYNESVIHTMLNFPFDAIVVKPQFAINAKQCIIDDRI